MLHFEPGPLAKPHFRDEAEGTSSSVLSHFTSLVRASATIEDILDKDWSQLASNVAEHAAFDASYEVETAIISASYAEGDSSHW